MTRAERIGLIILGLFTAASLVVAITALEVHRELRHQPKKGAR